MCVCGGGGSGAMANFIAEIIPDGDRVYASSSQTPRYFCPTLCCREESGTAGTLKPVSLPSNQLDRCYSCGDMSRS